MSLKYKLPKDVDDRYESYMPLIFEIAERFGSRGGVYALLIARGKYPIVAIAVTNNRDNKLFGDFLDALLDTNFDSSLCTELKDVFRKYTSIKNKPVTA